VEQSSSTIRNLNQTKAAKASKWQVDSFADTSFLKVIITADDFGKEVLEDCIQLVGAT
jgi:hypothetical protein